MRNAAIYWTSYIEKTGVNLKYIGMFTHNEALTSYFFIGYKIPACKLHKLKNKDS